LAFEVVTDNDTHFPQSDKGENVMRAVLSFCAFIAVSEILLSNVGVANEQDNGASKAEKDEYPYYVELVKLNYPYEMTAREKQEFVKKLSKLRAGDGYKKIVQLLGTPYMQQFISAHEKSDEVKGKSLVYYLKKRDSDVSQTDEFVELNLDMRGKLVELDSDNLEAELSKGVTEVPGRDSTWDGKNRRLESVERKIGKRKENK
jgi:hypothetical protein